MNSAAATGDESVMSETEKAAEFWISADTQLRHRTSCPATAPRRPDWQRRRRSPWPHDELRSRVLKAAVLVLRVPLRLLVSAAGVATIFSTSTPQGNEKDAQQGSYQSPQNEQAADAKLGIAGRWQNQQRGQYQGQQAKGCIACHWLHFSQRQRGRALSHLGCISHTASGSQRAGDLLPGSLCLSPAMRP